MSNSLSPKFTFGDAAVLMLLAGLWGFTFLFIEIALEGLTPLWLVACRTLAGAAVLLVVVRVRRLVLPRRLTMWVHLLVLAVPSNVVPWTLVAWAQQTIPSGLTAILYSLIPVTTFLIAAVAGMERFTVRKIIGLLTAVVGTIVVIGEDAGMPGRTQASLAVVAAVACLAGGAVYAKRYVSPHIRPLPMAAGQISLAFLASAAAALLFAPFPTAAALTPGVVASVTTLGVLGTGLAFMLYYRLIDRVGATNATLVTYLTPVIGLLAGWLVLQERVGASLLAGAAIIIVGMWYSQRQPALRPSPRER